MNLFFDLDGTLIDSKERLFRLFQRLVPRSSYSYSEYWRIKEQGISHREILMKEYNYSEKDYFKFEETWMSLIENPEYLELDRPFESTKEFLLSLIDNGNRIFIVTARQKPKLVSEQLLKFGWNPNMFFKILVTEQKFHKWELMEPYLDVIRSNNWIIGDTGHDINTGKKLKIKTAAVLTGFLNQKKLEEYNPDILSLKVIDINFK